MNKIEQQVVKIKRSMILSLVVLLVFTLGIMTNPSYATTNSGFEAGLNGESTYQIEGFNLYENLEFSENPSVKDIIYKWSETKPDFDYDDASLLASSLESGTSNTCSQKVYGDAWSPTGECDYVETGQQKRYLDRYEWVKGEEINIKESLWLDVSVNPDTFTYEGINWRLNETFSFLGNVYDLTTFKDVDVYLPGEDKLFRSGEATAPEGYKYVEDRSVEYYKMKEVSTTSAWVNKNLEVWSNADLTGMNTAEERYVKQAESRPVYQLQKYVPKVRQYDANGSKYGQSGFIAESYFKDANTYYRYNATTHLFEVLEYVSETYAQSGSEGEEYITLKETFGGAEAASINYYNWQKQNYETVWNYSGSYTYAANQPSDSAGVEYRLGTGTKPYYEYTLQKAIVNAVEYQSETKWFASDETVDIISQNGTLGTTGWKLSDPNGGNLQNEYEDYSYSVTSAWSLAQTGIEKTTNNYEDNDSTTDYRLDAGATILVPRWDTYRYKVSFSGKRTTLPSLDKCSDIRDASGNYYKAYEGSQCYTQGADETYYTFTKYTAQDTQDWASTSTKGYYSSKPGSTSTTKWEPTGNSEVRYRYDYSIYESEWKYDSVTPYSTSTRSDDVYLNPYTGEYYRYGSRVSQKWGSYQRQNYDWGSYGGSHTIETSSQSYSRYTVLQSGNTKYKLYNATENEEEYYERQQNERYDRVCFRVYKKEWFSDTYMGASCYYTDYDRGTNLSDLSRYRYSSMKYYDTSRWNRNSTIEQQTTSTYSGYTNPYDTGGSTLWSYEDRINFKLYPASSVDYGEYYVSSIYKGDNYTWRKTDTPTVSRWEDENVSSFTSGDYYYTYSDDSPGRWTQYDGSSTYSRTRSTWTGVQISTREWQDYGNPTDYRYGYAPASTSTTRYLYTGSYFYKYRYTKYVLGYKSSAVYGSGDTTYYRDSSAPTSGWGDYRTTTPYGGVEIPSSYTQWTKTTNSKTYTEYRKYTLETTGGRWVQGSSVNSAKPTLYLYNNDVSNYNVGDYVEGSVRYTRNAYSQDIYNVYDVEKYLYGQQYTSNTLAGNNIESHSKDSTDNQNRYFYDKYVFKNTYSQTAENNDYFAEAATNKNVIPINNYYGGRWRGWGYYSTHTNLIKTNNPKGNPEVVHQAATTSRWARVPGWISLKGDTTYTASLFVKNYENTNSSSFLKIYQNSGGDTYTDSLYFGKNYQVQTIDPETGQAYKNGWSRVYFTFTTQPDTSAVLFYSNSGSSNNLITGFPKIEEGGNLTPYEWNARTVLTGRTRDLYHKVQYEITGWETEGTKENSYNVYSTTDQTACGDTVCKWKKTGTETHYRYDQYKSSKKWLDEVGTTTVSSTVPDSLSGERWVKGALDYTEYVYRRYELAYEYVDEGTTTTINSGDSFPSDGETYRWNVKDYEDLYHYQEKEYYLHEMGNTIHIPLLEGEQQLQYQFTLGLGIQEKPNAVNLSSYSNGDIYRHTDGKYYKVNYNGIYNHRKYRIDEVETPITSNKFDVMKRVASQENYAMFEERVALGGYEFIKYTDGGSNFYVLAGTKQVYEWLEQYKDDADADYGMIPVDVPFSGLTPVYDTKILVTTLDNPTQEDIEVYFEGQKYTIKLLGSEPEYKIYEGFKETGSYVRQTSESDYYNPDDKIFGLYSPGLFESEISLKFTRFAAGDGVTTVYLTEEDNYYCVESGGKYTIYPFSMFNETLYDYGIHNLTETMYVGLTIDAGDFEQRMDNEESVVIYEGSSPAKQLDVFTNEELFGVNATYDSAYGIYSPAKGYVYDVSYNENFLELETGIANSVDEYSVPIMYKGTLDEIYLESQSGRISYEYKLKVKDREYKVVDDIQQFVNYDLTYFENNLFADMLGYRGIPVIDLGFTIDYNNISMQKWYGNYTSPGHFFAKSATKNAYVKESEDIQNANDLVGQLSDIGQYGDILGSEFDNSRNFMPTYGTDRPGEMLFYHKGYAEYEDADANPFIAAKDYDIYILHSFKNQITGEWDNYYNMLLKERAGASFNEMAWSGQITQVCDYGETGLVFKKEVTSNCHYEPNYGHSLEDYLGDKVVRVGDFVYVNLDTTTFETTPEEGTISKADQFLRFEYETTPGEEYAKHGEVDTYQVFHHEVGVHKALFFNRKMNYNSTTLGNLILKDTYIEPTDPREGFGVSVHDKYVNNEYTPHNDTTRNDTRKTYTYGVDYISPLLNQKYVIETDFESYSIFDDPLNPLKLASKYAIGNGPGDWSFYQSELPDVPELDIHRRSFPGADLTRILGFDATTVVRTPSQYPDGGTFERQFVYRGIFDGKLRTTNDLQDSYEIPIEYNRGPNIDLREYRPSDLLLSTSLNEGKMYQELNANGERFSLPRNLQYLEPNPDPLILPEYRNQELKIVEYEDRDGRLQNSRLYLFYADNTNYSASEYNDERAEGKDTTNTQIQVVRYNGSHVTKFVDETLNTRTVTSNEILNTYEMGRYVESPQINVQTDNTKEDLGKYIALYNETLFLEGETSFDLRIQPTISAQDAERQEINTIDISMYYIETGNESCYDYHKEVQGDGYRVCYLPDNVTKTDIQGNGTYVVGSGTYAWEQFDYDHTSMYEGFKPDTEYHYEVRYRNLNGNVSLTESRTFQIGSDMVSVPDYKADVTMGEKHIAAGDTCGLSDFYDGTQTILTKEQNDIYWDCLQSTLTFEKAYRFLDLNIYKVVDGDYANKTLVDPSYGLTIEEILNKSGYAVEYNNANEFDFEDLGYWYTQLIEGNQFANPVVELFNDWTMYNLHFDASSVPDNMYDDNVTYLLEYRIKFTEGNDYNYFDFNGDGKMNYGAKGNYYNRRGYPVFGTEIDMAENAGSVGGEWSDLMTFSEERIIRLIGGKVYLVPINADGTPILVPSIP